MIWLGIVVCGAVIFLPVNFVAIGFGVFGVFIVGVAIARLRRRQSVHRSESEATQQQQDDLAQPESITRPENPSFRRYRVPELERVVASLKANSAILVFSEEGMGKSVLADAVVNSLTDEGFVVVQLEISTSRHMLKDLADQLGVATVVDPLASKTKALTLDELKRKIESHLEELKENQEFVFLVIDDAHKCDSKFRDWLKTLKRQGVLMFLTATNPPRSDIFLNLPRIELGPLPDSCIREIMEQAATERGIALDSGVLANLQQRAGGNPMLAQRAVHEEHLGIDNEAGDHNEYFDISPLIMLVGVFFIASKFLARGFNDPALYVLCSIASTVFMGLSKVFYSLPKESKRIE